MRRIPAILMMFLVLVAGEAVWASQSGGENLVATVKRLDGDAQVLRAGTDKWQELAVDMTIAGGDEFVTGYRSELELVLADDDYVATVYTIRSLSACTLHAYLRTAKGMKVRFFLKQGTIKADITKSEIKMDMLIFTPVSVTAIRGTKVARIHYSMDGGFDIRMGPSGLIAVSDSQGYKTKAMAAGDGGDERLLTSADYDKLGNEFQLLPDGCTVMETAAVAMMNARTNFLPGERSSGGGFGDPDSVRRANQGRQHRRFTPVSSDDCNSGSGSQPGTLPGGSPGHPLDSF